MRLAFSLLASYSYAAAASSFSFSFKTSFKKTLYVTPKTIKLIDKSCIR